MTYKQYSMHETLDIASRASKEITQWLYQRSALGKSRVVRVENVEADPDYQAWDVDLLVQLSCGSQSMIEIKADRYHHTGNFFFETISNAERGTPGCFLYTRANYVFYYFIEIKKLFILPMPRVRDWFTTNLQRFDEKSTTTPIGNGRHYTTRGRLVPICILTEALGDYIEVHHLPG
ncbi:MAG: hypothetical protein Q4B94_03590 [Pseudomonadota bacterium]|nr:hypothetical protein [Pseudomonadota bacterium]